ncbi:hypothetical protein VU04_03295 [Desulfobulbus sp. TB]|nr:hypothetical protein [Desulfobulbus sp. TB]
MKKCPTLALSTNLQKAVQWIGEVMQGIPATQYKQRNQVINEAQFRFDLTPAECEFLHQNFKK